MKVRLHAVYHICSSLVSTIKVNELNSTYIWLNLNELNQTNLRHKRRVLLPRDAITANAYLIMSRMLV